MPWQCVRSGNSLQRHRFRSQWDLCQPYSDIYQHRGPRLAPCPCGAVPLPLLPLHRRVFQVADTTGEDFSCTQVLTREAVTPQGDMHKAGSGARGRRGERGSFPCTPQLFPMPAPELTLQGMRMPQRGGTMNLQQALGACGGQEPGSPSALALPQQIAVCWVSRKSH